MVELIGIPLNINSYINSSLQELALNAIPEVEAKVNGLIPSIDSLNVDTLSNSIQDKLLSKLKEQISKTDIASKLEENFNKIKEELNKLSVLCAKIQTQLIKYRNKIEKLINRIEKFFNFLDKIFNENVLKFIQTGITIARIYILLSPIPGNVKEPQNTILNILSSLLSMFSIIPPIIDKFKEKLAQLRERILPFIDRVISEIEAKCKKIAEAIDKLLNSTIDYIKDNFPDTQTQDASTQEAIKNQNIDEFTKRLNKGLDNLEVIYRFTNNMEVFSYEVKKI